MYLPHLFGLGLPPLGWEMLGDLGAVLRNGVISGNQGAQ